MLVNLSSDASDAGESLCSLRFAKQVNQTELGQAKRSITTSSKSLRVNTHSEEDEGGNVTRIPGPARGRRPNRSTSTTRARLSVRWRDLASERAPGEASQVRL